MGAESGLRRVTGLSDAVYRIRFRSEERCRAALYELGWDKDWVCPACAHGHCAELGSSALYKRKRCKQQVRLTAGTMFHQTKLPLTTWFVAIYHLCQSKVRMPSVEVARVSRRRGISSTR